MDGYLIDNVTVTAAPPPPLTILVQATFDSSAEGFAYADDTFRGTNQPSYASGNRITSGRYSGGALRVYLGGVNNTAINNMSGGWPTTINLSARAGSWSRFATT